MGEQLEMAWPRGDLYKYLKYCFDKKLVDSALRQGHYLLIDQKSLDAADPLIITADGINYLNKT